MTHLNADQAVIAMGEALGRYRSLTDVESLLVERATRRENRRLGLSTRMRWEPEDDAALLKAAGRLKPDQIAQTLKRSVPAINCRLSALRKMRKAKDCLNGKRRRVAQVKGVRV